MKKRLIALMAAVCLAAAPVSVLAEEETETDVVEIPVHEDADTIEKEIYYNIMDAFGLTKKVTADINNVWAFVGATSFSTDTMSKLCDVCSLDEENIDNAIISFLDERYADDGGWEYMSRDGHDDMDVWEYIIFGDPTSGDFIPIIRQIHVDNGDVEMIETLLETAKSNIKSLDKSNENYDALKDFYTNAKSYYDSCVGDIKTSYINYASMVQTSEGELSDIASDLEFELF